MWKKCISKYVTILQYDDPRLLGLSLKLPQRTILFINVFLTTNNPENDELFTFYLGKLSSIISTCEEDIVCILGDINAAPSSPRFGEYLSVVEEQHLPVAYVDLLPDTRYTYVNHGTLSHSWLNHYIVSQILYNVLSDRSIMYNLVHLIILQ